ncbi:MAG: VIT and VWA domain-containing protein, partial [Thermoanaerobaculales bacterium]|nr:VIT and VWA domain-containing protein [Thermoanaerobaculales bacterium]
MGAEAAEVMAGAYVAAKGWAREAAQAIPLLGVAVRAEITGPLTRVVARQRYRNQGRVAIEAVYVFPAPEKAAVTGLVIETGGRRIVGTVKEKEEAFEIYDEALAAGHGAVLLDQHRPNVFQASVGNLEPGQEMVVELAWVMELGWEGEALRFVLPTTVAPRYAPAEDRVGVGQSEAEKLNPPTAFEVPYGLEFRAEVDVPGGLAGIGSPSHPLRWTPRGEGATVELSHETAAMNEDLVLLITPAAPRAPQVVVERQPEGGAVAALSFLPRLEAGAREPREVIFVIDRSGSMGGSSIEEARRALQLCLRSLQEGDRFDIISFGSSHRPMFGECRPYSQSSLDEAAAYVEAIYADMGGTEIMGPLAEALERRGAGVQRAVVLLTDGEVSNDGAVIELARRHAHTARVFTIGIGHGPSEHLINGVARASGGAAEFIKPGERIEPKVLRQFARIGAPVVEGVRVEWNGSLVEERAPYRQDQLFDGEPYLVYLRLPELEAGTVRLAGQLGGHEVSWELAVDPAQAAEGAVVGPLAARAAIRDLEEGTSRLHAEGGSKQRGRREARVTKAIVELGLRYRLASSQTSFVAIEEREGKEQPERGRLVLVPQALTRDWGVMARMTIGGGMPAPPVLTSCSQMDVDASFSVLEEDAFEAEMPVSSGSYGQET